MRKSIVIVLILLVVALVAGVFYRNYKLEKETGEKEGLKMGYLYGFNDAKAGNPLKTENLAKRLFITGDSTYDKAFLSGATKGYHKGYEAGKEGD